MRTGSHLQAWFKGERATEFALFSLLGGSPGTSMSAERAARLILDAAARGQSDAVIPFTVSANREVVGVLSPNATVNSLAAVNAMMPDGRDARRDARQVTCRCQSRPRRDRAQ